MPAINCGQEIGSGALKAYGVRSHTQGRGFASERQAEERPLVPMKDYYVAAIGSFWLSEYKIPE